MTGPEPDWEQAPFTGWGRQHWEAAADEQIAAAWRHSSPGGAQVRFPSEREQDDVDLLEGFARTFLLAAQRLAGARGNLGGSMSETAQWYARALDAGTDPESAERWPRLTDHGQATVEATAVVLGLHFSRPWVWDAVPQRVRDNTAAWLQASAQSFGADNNHVMFAATIQAFLASAGYAHDAVGIEAALARIEDWYVGDGWYSDGEGRRFDHYNAWTFHLYPFFILDMLAEPDSTGRRQVYKDRLAQFVHGYSHLFGADGAPLIQGRSLIYRWGVAAPFWMALREGVTAVSPGQARRLASGTLKYFLDGGAAPDGVLTLGWHGADSSILQSYNAPGSPQWAAKGFFGLLLPPDHPAWTEPEQPLPVEQGDFTLPLAGPGWFAVGTRETGTVRVLNAGTDGHPQKDGPLYRRLAFSTATVPWLGQPPGVRDNDIHVPGPGGGSRHRGLLGGSVRPGGGASTFVLDANGRDVRVQSSFAVIDGVEVRAAKLTGVVGLTPAISGYLSSANEALHSRAEPGAAEAGSAPGTQSSLLLLDSSGEARARVVHGGATILGTCSAMPVLDWLPLRSNELRVLYLVGLEVSLAGLQDFAVRLHWEWAPDGVQLLVDEQHVVLPWQRKTPWLADSINQGVFRWEPPKD
ncbi:DUF2264 domain-containing protein [Arthrobacter sp. H35-D1]|uniref:DUF2264 domain-containing protein n=1 Tax=Arthrobacter sp. H35-D1 TaxID=3046202 RepID=UPI0024B8A9FC|nr:DUF2264 domain-containing protein [Arthrobacter sp. H35-D1]MDJ0314459.1 DUF2264 domain-containing protein [Arthrobacter sp. H35-D1]